MKLAGVLNVSVELGFPFRPLEDHVEDVTSGLCFWRRRALPPGGRRHPAAGGSDRFKSRTVVPFELGSSTLYV